MSGSLDGSVVVWNFAPKLRAFRYIGHTDAVHSVAYDGVNNLVATASKDKTVRLWTPTAAGRSTVIKAHTAAVRCCAFSQNGRMLATCSDDKTVKVGAGGWRAGWRMAGRWALAGAGLMPTLAQQGPAHLVPVTALPQPRTSMSAGVVGAAAKIPVQPQRPHQLGAHLPAVAGRPPGGVWRGGPQCAGVGPGDPRHLARI